MKRRKKTSKKKTLVFLLILTIFFIISAKSSSCCTGKGDPEYGTITKYCAYDGGIPIEGAEVYLLQMGITQFTDVSGATTFVDVLEGDYSIYVDIDDDGTWDGSDFFTLGPGEQLEITNWFTPPEVLRALSFLD